MCLGNFFLIGRAVKKLLGFCVHMMKKKGRRNMQVFFPLRINGQYLRIENLSG